MNPSASPPNASSLPTRYLVAIDETESAVMVLDMACGVASALGGAAELHIVHVVPPPGNGPGLTLPAVPSDFDANGRAVLARCKEHAATRFGGTLVLHLAVGSAWEEIVRVASDLSADLVLVGTSSRTGLARVLLGSVAEQVVRHARCPVLVLRMKEHQREVAIEPPCGDCVAVQTETNRAQLWCARHSVHHPHGNLHYELPQTFGVGSMNFRP